MQSIGVRSIQPKFQPVRPGKLVHLKRWTRFFQTFPVGPNRSIEFWTEIFGKFWLNGSRPWGLVPRSDFPPLRRGWPRFKADAYLEKKHCSQFHLSCNWQWPFIAVYNKDWKIFLNDSFDILKVQTKKRT